MASGAGGIGLRWRKRDHALLPPVPGAPAQVVHDAADALIQSHRQPDPDQAQAQARALWAYREDISESLHRHTPHKADIALPVARVAEFLAAWRPLVAERLPGIEALCFGHVGDGNLHLNLLRPADEGLSAFLDRVHAFDDELYALVQAHDGSISAEHGVGLLKRDHLHFSRTPTEIALMRGIKAVLDPAGLLNPGKIF